MNRWGIFSAIILTTLLVYSNSFPGQFHYDDYPLILENRLITADAYDYTTFLELYGGRPLTLWTFFYNLKWAGAEPFYFHFISVVLHALSAGLLFLLVGQHLPKIPSFLAALIFAIHPSQTQAVNYIWSRSLLLMGVFVFLALLTRRDRPWWSLLFLQLAIFSRIEALVSTLPLFLLNTKRWKDLFLLAALNLTGIFAGLLRYQPKEIGWGHSDPLGYLMKAPVVLWSYFGQMVWPLRFSVFHGHLEVSRQQELVAFLLILLALSLTLFSAAKKHPAALGLLWAVLFLLPSLLVPNSQSFNESRSYVAFAGVALGLAWVVWTAFKFLSRRQALYSNYPPGKGRRVAAVFVLGLSLFAAVSWIDLTRSRNLIWQSDVSLWQETVTLYPANFKAHYNLGVAYSKERRLAEAQKEFEQSISLNPLDDMSYAALGYCAELSNDPFRALASYRRASTLNPDNEYARIALERLAGRLGNEVE